MKKAILLILIVCTVTSFGFAQINTGSIFCGLDFNVNSVHAQTDYSQNTGNNLSNTQTTFMVMPAAGYFFAEDLVAGLSLGYSGTSSQDLISNTKTSNSGLTFSPFVRKYYNIGEKAALFVQLNLGYTSTWGSREYSSGPNDQMNGSIVGFSVAPGLSYFISEKFELEAGIALLGYTYSSNKTIPGNGSEHINDSNSNFQLNLTMSAISFGFKYYLRKS